MRSSYIKYLHKKRNIDEILIDYKYDEDFGTYFHKETNIPICINCLYKYEEPIKLQKIKEKIGDDKYIRYACNMSECNKYYHKVDSYFPKF